LLPEVGEAVSQVAFDDTVHGQEEARLNPLTGLTVTAPELGVAATLTAGTETFTLQVGGMCFFLHLVR
jgi:hypothetical protein